MTNSDINLLMGYKYTNPYVSNLKGKYQNMTPFSEEETEYVQRNMLFTPIPLHTTLKIGNDSRTLLSKRFNRDVTSDEVKVTYLMGEVSGKYHFVYCPEHGKYIDFFTSTTDTENPYHKKWMSTKVDYEKVLPPNTITLLPHQPLAVHFLLHEKKCFLLDSQGLGKTFTSITAAMCINTDKKILVVTLPSLTVNWKRELSVVKQPCHIINKGVITEKDMDAIDKVKFVVVGYDILKNIIIKTNPNNPKKSEKYILPFDFECIIIDECHSVKHSESIRSKAIQHIIVKQNPKYVWGLSGTLIEYNKDLQQICMSLGINTPQIYTKTSSFSFNQQLARYEFFLTRYCGQTKITKKDGGHFWVQKTQEGRKILNENTIELHQSMKNIMLRRLKKEVFANFVEKYADPVYFTLNTDEQDEYDRYFQEVYKVTKGRIDYGEMEKLVEMLVLRKFLAVKKVPLTIEHLEYLLDLGHKILVFTHFIEEIDLLVSGVKRILGKNEYCLSVNASMSSTKIQDTIKNFNTNQNARILIGNISTLGTGHNITSAQCVVFNSPNFNFSNMDQAEDRAYRFGQKEDVYVYYMLYENTVEEAVFNLRGQKQDNTTLFLHG